jgi:hypothetical protein
MVCTQLSVDAGAPDAASGVDGGGQGDAGDAGPPMVCVVPTDDPTSTRLWGALRGAGGLNNMPYAPQGAPGVTFTQQDLDRISAWIREGAQDN